MSRYNKYFIAKSGDILDAAEKFRRDKLLFSERMMQELEKLNAQTARVSFRGNVFSIKFEDGKTPTGFKKPDKNGFTEPYKNNKEWHDILQALPVEPQAYQYIEPVLKCQTAIIFKNGFCAIGHPFYPFQVCWYSADSPLLIITPDLEKSLLEHDDRELADDFNKEWIPPDGLEEILIEQWDLWAAQHRKMAA